MDLNLDRSSFLVFFFPFAQFFGHSRSICLVFDRFINHQSNRKNVPEKTVKSSFVDHKIRLLKPKRLAMGIFGHLVFSFF